MLSISKSWNNFPTFPFIQSVCQLTALKWLSLCITYLNLQRSFPHTQTLTKQHDAISLHMGLMESILTANVLYISILQGILYMQLRYCYILCSIHTAYVHKFSSVEWLLNAGSTWLLLLLKNQCPASKMLSRTVLNNGSCIHKTLKSVDASP